MKLVVYVARVEELRNGDKILIGKLERKTWA